MARVQLHIRAVTRTATNAQAKAIEKAAEALQELFADAGGEYGGNPDIELDESPANPHKNEHENHSGKSEKAVLGAPHSRGTR